MQAFFINHEEILMLFQTEKAALKPNKIITTVYDAMFLSSAVLGFGSALLFAGSLDKVSKALLSSTGLAGMACYTINCKASEKVRKVDAALNTVQWESMKYSLKEEEEIYKLNAEIQGATRKVDLIINKADPWAWAHWAKEAKVVENMPPLQDLTNERVEQPVPVEHRTIETQEISFEQEMPDLAKQLADDMKNTLIVGVPGSGKGLLASNALQHVQDRGDTTVFYVDPKNDSKETGYFTGRVNHLFRLPGGIIKAQAVDVYLWLNQCFQAYENFNPGNGRKLLVLDELTSLIRKLANVPAKVTGTVKGSDWLEEQIITYAAAGDSAGATLWGIAQNGHNTGVGMDGGAKSQLTPIALISIKQLPASQALLKADFVPQDHKLSSNEIKRICEQSPIGRAIFHGGLNEWYPMPVLPNPSGYDRDNRRVVEQPTTTPAPTVQTTVVENIPTDSNHPSINGVHDQMVAWMQSLETFPNAKEVKDKWESLTGQEMSIKALKAMLIALGLEKP
jgi:hypothetical protein